MKQALKLMKAALRVNTPVLFGYIFLGMAFGLMLQDAGYGVLWALVCSTFIYAGSMQFVLVSFLTGNLSILQMVIVTLSVQIRHVFYGLSLIEPYQKMGKRKFYMIHALTDETYSLLCTAKAPEGTNEQDFFFSIAAMDHLYWILGGVLGVTVGQLITFDTTGVDFTMTALFTVIFVENWLSGKGGRIPAVIGLGSALLCLLIFGPDRFLLPALVLAVALLFLLRGLIEKNSSGQTAAAESEEVGEHA